MKHRRKVHQAPTGRLVYAAHERDHHLTTAGRRALDARWFALPPGDEERRRGIAGRVPFDTEGRAHAALARLGQMHHRGTLTDRQLALARGKILRAWPAIQPRSASAKRVFRGYDRP